MLLASSALVPVFVAAAAAVALVVEVAVATFVAIANTTCMKKCTSGFEWTN